jgi:transcriptional repressor NF-X1
MICIGVVGRRDKVWTCDRCFAILHHKCIEQWFSSKKLDRTKNGKAIVSWPCPGCMHAYSAKPARYTCFCGKAVEPDHNPYLTPHSCGETCGKMRGEAGSECPHPCNIPCHPGICPPCPAFAPPRRCACAKTTYQIRCGEKEKAPRQCANVCEKPLACGDPSHLCTRICHDGPCDPCKAPVTHTCFCGELTEDRACGSGAGEGGDGRGLFFSCESPCNKLLECGLHRCRRSCHSGDCFACTLQPTHPQFCACGKKTSEVWSRALCTDLMPICGKRCDGVLPCLVHNCRKKCHNGPCGECTQKVSLQCYCGRDQIGIPCDEYMTLKQTAAEEQVHERTLVRCKKVCKVRLDCQQHVCGGKCCTGEGFAHHCDKRCNKELECGHHTCDLTCHLGFCQPCEVLVREGISCVCGKSKLPGVQRCGTERPACKFSCSRERSCGHACAYQCHTHPCPPCAVLGPRVCGGGHVTLSNIPCYVTGATCDRICARPLACGLHTCKRSCHVGLCDPSAVEPTLQASLTATGPVACSRKCGATRPCGHPCTTLCHPALSCPDKVCKAKVEVTCPCRRRKDTVSCGLQNADSTPGTLPKLRDLECDNECELLQRNLRLRQAFSISEESPGGEESLPFTKLLLDRVLAEGLATAVPKIEAMLADALRGLGANKTKHLPPMARKQRWLAHQMAAVCMYVCLCECV